MDLISREAVKKYISAPCTYVEGRRIFYVEDLDLIGSPFEGMTNGEVIKAVFPNMTITHKSSNGVLIVVENLDSPYPHEFYTEWWNSPYQKGGE